MENERKKRRPSHKKRQSALERQCISGVHCQQFFIQGPKSQLFEIMREEETDAGAPVANP